MRASAEMSNTRISLGGAFSNLPWASASRARLFGDKRRSEGPPGWVHVAAAGRAPGSARRSTVNGISFETTLALLPYSNVIADGTSVATVPVAVAGHAHNQGLVRGRSDPELNLISINGYSAYVRGSVRLVASWSAVRQGGAAASSFELIKYSDEINPVSA